MLHAALSRLHACAKSPDVQQTGTAGPCKRRRARVDLSKGSTMEKKTESEREECEYANVYYVITHRSYPVGVRARMHLHLLLDCCVFFSFILLMRVCFYSCANQRTDRTGEKQVFITCQMGVDFLTDWINELFHNC